MTEEETVSRLNALIETSRNGELGYAEASRLVDETRLQAILEGYSQERAGFVKALQAEVRKLGGTPAQSGTIGAALHRGWMEFKAVATLGDGSAILAACETGESSAWTHYNEATDSAISGESRTLVEKQFEKIKEAIAHLQHLQGELSVETPE
jgi:uncharacterized protein (TIGR02284 family)